jgi:phosphoribosylanthranilate isomerase
MWRVKVCGLTRWEDVLVACKAEADACGFVLEPTSPRYIGEKPWKSGIGPSPGGAINVGVMGEPIFDLSEDVWRLFQVAQSFGGGEIAGKARMPVFRPSEEMKFEEWLESTKGWEWCLLDPHHEGMAGGTGTTLDWDMAARFVKEFKGKVILAGGLGPENVREAVLRVRPFGVDASSRLESSPGMKDADKVRAYVSEAWDGLCSAHGRSIQDLWDETSGIRLSL